MVGVDSEGGVYYPGYFLPFDERVRISLSAAPVQQGLLSLSQCREKPVPELKPFELSELRAYLWESPCV